MGNLMVFVKFLIDADMPKSCKGVIEKLGYKATDVRDIGLGSASDKKIVEYAHSHEYVILTRDLDFGDIVRYPIEKHRGVIILRLPYTFTASEINRFLQMKRS